MPLCYVEEGPNRGAWFPLVPGESVIGRQAGVQVPVLDERASRRHAALRLDDGRITLEDLESRHGTLLNGLPVVEATPVEPGDRVRVGDTVLRIEDDAEALGEDDAPPTVSVAPPAAGAPAPQADPEALVGLLAYAHGKDALTQEGLARFLLRAIETTGASGARVDVEVQSGARPLALAGDEGVSADAPRALTIELRDGDRPLGRLVIGEGGNPPDPRAWRALAAVVSPWVKGLLERGRREASVARSRGGLQAAPELVAKSDAMRDVLGQVLKVARKDACVLVTGESGTGKEVIANAIHQNGPRREHPFIAVNAGALPGTLFESEVFGHERGAFTGAVARRKGLFELAHRGTLFLDEVGELSAPAQAALLRVLETGELRRVGGTETVRTDVRLVAATHRDLAAMVEDGTFRQDLYYRLAVVVLHLPPLRERADDIPPLVESLLVRLADGRPPRVTEAFTERLLAYDFPGNVRELRNVLERALILADGEELDLLDLPPEVRGPARAPAAAASEGGAAAPPEGAVTLADVERLHIAKVLAETGWVKKHAAEVLGIDRKTLGRKVKEYGLAP